MVIYCVTKMITGSQMTGHLFDTVIVTKPGYNETAQSTEVLGRARITVVSHLNLDIRHH